MTFFIQINAAWEDIQAMIADKHQRFNGVASIWQQYTDAKQGVMKIVDDVQPLLQQDLAFSKQEDVKKSLDQHKVGYLSCHNSENIY